MNILKLSTLELKRINQKMVLVFTSVSLALFSLSFVNSAHAQVQIEKWQTTNGAKVLFVESPQLPMLDIEISFDAGSARDGKHWGLSSFTSGLIGSATSKLNEEQINKGFDELGAQFGASSTRDSASLSLRTLTRPEILEKSLNLFTQVVTDSQFKQAVFERERKRLVVALKQEKVKPNSVASRALFNKLYGTHPYAHPVAGTEESVAKITPKLIAQFYNKYYTAQNAVIAIVGKLSKTQAQQLAEKISTALPQGQKPTAIAKPTEVNAADILIEFDATQTVYHLAQLGVERGHPDYVALFVGNHILGGSGFGSLLMEEVREKRGLVYSVYSYFAPLRTTGPFIIGLGTKNASAYEADSVVKQTLADFEAGFSNEKLEAIKGNLIGGFPLRIDSNAKILGYLSLIGLYDLPLDYLEWFPKEVEKLTKGDVLAAWKRHIKTENMVRVMVGKPQDNESSK